MSSVTETTPLDRLVENIGDLDDSGEVERMADQIAELASFIDANSRESIVAALGEEGLGNLLMKLNAYRDEVTHEQWRYHIPTWYQKQFLRSMKRSRWIFAANRVGKSLTGCGYEPALFSLGVPHPWKPNFRMRTPSLGWICGESYGAVYENIMPYLLAFLPKDMIERVPRLRYDQITGVHLRNGSRIQVKTYAQGDETIAGGTIDWSAVDEEPSEIFYNELKMRGLRHKGWMWGTITPLKGLTFLYHKLFLNPSHDPEVEIFNYDTTGGWSMHDNPFLDADEIERILADYPDEEREAREFGRFIGRSGLVYPWLSDNRAYCDPFPLDPRGWQFYRVIDPAHAGITACGWFAVDQRDNLVMFDEYYQSGLDIEEHAANINLKHPDKKFVLTLIDPHSSQRNMEAAGGKTMYELYREALARGDYPLSPLVPAEDDIDSGIAKVWMYMKSARVLVEKGDVLEYPSIRFFRTLKHVKFEGRQYMFPNYKTGDMAGERKNKPAAKHNHLMDCIKYIAHQHPRWRFDRAATERRVFDRITGY